MRRNQQLSTENGSGAGCGASAGPEYAESFCQLKRQTGGSTEVNPVERQTGHLVDQEEGHVPAQGHAGLDVIPSLGRDP